MLSPESLESRFWDGFAGVQGDRFRAGLVLATAFHTRRRDVFSSERVGSGHSRTSCSHRTGGSSPTAGSYSNRSAPKSHLSEDSASPSPAPCRAVRMDGWGEGGYGIDGQTDG